MNRIPEGIVNFAGCGEVKVKTTRPQDVVLAVHKGSYQKMGKVFWKFVRWVENNGYEIVDPPITLCYNNTHTTPEEELINECPFLVRKRRSGRCRRMIKVFFEVKRDSFRGKMCHP